MREPPQHLSGTAVISGWLLTTGGLLLLAALVLPDVYASAFHPTNESLRLYSAATLEAGGGADVAPVFDIVNPRWRERGAPPNIDAATHEGRWLLDKPPGTTLLSVPVLRVMRWLGLTAENNRMLRILALLLCALPSLIAAWWLGRRFLPTAGVSLHAAFAVVLLAATPWAFLAVRLFGHATSTAFLTLGVLLLLGPAFKEPEDASTVPARFLGGGAGILLGLAVVVETTLVPAVVLAVMVALALPETRPRGLWSVAGGVVPAAVLAWWNTSLFGSPLSFGYGFKWHAGHAEIVDAGLFGFTWPTLDNLHGLLLSRERGLFLLAPWLLPGVVGVAVASWDRTVARPWRIFLPLMVVGYTLWIASFGDWHAGWFAGPRHLLPVVPFLGAGALVMGAALARWRAWPAGAAPALVLGTAVGATWLTLHVSASLVYFPEAVEDPIARLAHGAWDAAGPYPVLGATGAAAATLLRLLVSGGIACVAVGLCLSITAERLRWRLSWAAAVLAAVMATLLLALRMWGAVPTLEHPDPQVRAGERAGMELRLEQRGPREERLMLPLELP